MISCILFETLISSADLQVYKIPTHYIILASLLSLILKLINGFERHHLSGLQFKGGYQLDEHEVWVCENFYF